ncbi:hypothetical protein XA68_11845 [Ophiocordyceps unilateralis]|uniref:Ecp2 effector protein-like domain-containing protein n=1 Tax=Ophiocordyceps unilateralis TaxID=268505 RepID=A0A2A9PG16_OPHUN|nr:hypothetical protein XA68_11845 [Ophiocordyceps unilateralis]
MASSATHPLILAVLLASPLAQAVSVSSLAPFNNITGVSWSTSPATLSTCDPAAFSYDLSLDAADWRQCAALHSQWTTEKGYFRVARPDRGAYVPILSETDCSLAVEPLGPLYGPYIIGNKDIEDILFKSLHDFSRGTLLAVNGTVSCDAGNGGRAPLAWKISKSAGPAPPRTAGLAKRVAVSIRA